MIKILSHEQIMQVEQTANESGISYARLMENAGSACAKIIRDRFEDSGFKNAVIICGKGKNGGDGFVIARKLFENGYRVSVLLADGLPTAETAVEMCRRAKDLGVNIEMYDETNENHNGRIASADIVVDCIFGTGFRGEPDERTARLFERISASDGFVVSVDLPSGLYTDSSAVCSSVVKADMTIAVIALKYSLVYFPSAEYAGEIKVVSIGIPEDIIDKYVSTYSLGAEDIKLRFPKRSEDSNKGDYGKALIIAGSYEMPGAALLAGTAAVKGGAGIVKSAFPDKAYPVMMSQSPELLLIPLPSNTDGTMSSDAIQRLAKELTKCDCVLIGCGMGNNADTLRIVEFVLENSEVPVILDADALNVICRRPEFIKNAKAPVIITPHPGEAVRLLGVDVSAVQTDRITAAKQLCELTGACVVLKGSRTVVSANGSKFYVNMTGNSALATAGSGDVLAGLIAAFVAQGLSPYSASICGTYIHGLAGESVAAKASMTGTTALAVADELPKVLGSFEDK
jgi:NAD(P)H-hydrate epimerase